MKKEILIDEEFQALIRPLSDGEFRLLELDVIKVGCRDPLVLWGNILIDGHHRYRICTEHSIPFNTVQQEFASRDDAKEWIIKNQFGRRNLSSCDRCKLALELDDVFRRKALAQQGRRTDLLPKLAKSLEHINAREELAKMAGVSHGTLDKVRKILEKATPEQRALLDREEASITQIYNEIKGVSCPNNNDVGQFYKTLMDNRDKTTTEQGMEIIACLVENSVNHVVLINPYIDEGWHYVMVISIYHPYGIKGPSDEDENLSAEEWSNKYREYMDKETIVSSYVKGAVRDDLIDLTIDVLFYPDDYTEKVKKYGRGELSEYPEPPKYQKSTCPDWKFGVYFRERSEEHPYKYMFNEMPTIQCGNNKVVKNHKGHRAHGET